MNVETILSSLLIYIFTLLLKNFFIIDHLHLVLFCFAYDSKKQKPIYMQSLHDTFQVKLIIDSLLYVLINCS